MLRTCLLGTCALALVAGEQATEPTKPIEIVVTPKSVNLNGSCAFGEDGRTVQYATFSLNCRIGLPLSVEVDGKKNEVIKVDAVKVKELVTDEGEKVAIDPNDPTLLQSGRPSAMRRNFALTPGGMPGGMPGGVNPIRQESLDVQLSLPLPKRSVKAFAKVVGSAMLSITDQADASLEIPIKDLVEGASFVHPSFPDQPITLTGNRQETVVNLDVPTALHGLIKNVVCKTADNVNRPVSMSGSPGMFRRQPSGAAPGGFERQPGIDPMKGTMPLSLGMQGGASFPADGKLVITAWGKTSQVPACFTLTDLILPGPEIKGVPPPPPPANLPVRPRPVGMTHGDPAKPAEAPKAAEPPKATEPPKAAEPPASK